ncbi:MAG: hypothetical protein J0I12_07390 [Candidatus Eremiobacteraeota bacterium]|nr:hypothetical protein [Candidatus Eremiobacteraeota bacterium]
MSSITTLKSSTTSTAAGPRRPSQKPQAATPATAFKDSASLSGEATSPTPSSSLPSFAARVEKPKATPTRDLPYRMPKTETPEQKRAREKRDMKKVDDIERDMDRRWKAHGGGIMKSTPGSRPKPLKAAGLPYRLPKTETPQQKQARQDRECGELRKLHDKHERSYRPIMTPEN